MSTVEDLAVGYHQQDTNYYCGAACAQMVLNEIGAGLISQADLYASNHSHSVAEPGWFTAPDGLKWTLVNRRPPSFTNTFALFELGNEDSISRKIVWTIHHYRVAPIALVYGSNHWIVVRGYEASAPPSSSSDTSYSITAFNINNPWPPTPTPAPPPPHTSGDACGTGGMRGVADEHISYWTWRSTYMTGVPSGHWAGKFVAVCDPEPPPDSIGQPPPAPQRLAGERLLTLKEAARQAQNGLAEFGLPQRQAWSRALTKTAPGEPVLVQRLDHPDSFYYLVPMNSSAKRAPVLVSVDGRFGNYRQSILLPEGTPPLISRPDPRKVTEIVTDKRWEFSDRRGELLVRKEAAALHPTLVWKPCLESLSPFYPFQMLTTATDRIYIRVDGQVFTKLHDEERGI